MSYTAIPLAELPESLHPHVDPSQPKPVRIMCAKGIAPLGPADRLVSLYALMGDPDPEVAEAAVSSFAGLPDTILAPAFKSVADGRVLSYALAELANDDQRADALLDNLATPADAIALYAGRAETGKTLDRVAENQQRMLESPKLISALYNNSHTPQVTLTRILEYAAREGVVADDIPELGGMTDEQREELRARGIPELTKQEAVEAVSNDLPSPL